MQRLILAAIVFNQASLASGEWFTCCLPVS